MKNTMEVRKITWESQMRKRRVHQGELVEDSQQEGLSALEGAAAAPLLTNIPYVGWVAAGWIAMFGQDQGAEIGGELTTSMMDCE